MAQFQSLGWRLMVFGLCLGLGACGSIARHFMPAEIVSMEKRTSALASQIAKDRPQASQKLVVDGRPIHYVEMRDDQPKPLVIFVHGSPGEWVGWADYLVDSELQQRAHMIAVDRPGFGDSGWGKAELSLKQQSKDVAALLEKSSPGQRIIVVGHSYGGPVVARMAMDYPNKVTDVIILAGSIDPAQEHTAWYQYPADWAVFSWMLPTNLVVANREIRALKGELTMMLPLWSGVRQRVSVIQGEKDNLVPPANADFAAHVLTNAESLNITRIPNRNHFIPWTEFKVVKAEILHHLN